VHKLCTIIEYVDLSLSPLGLNLLVAPVCIGKCLGELLLNKDSTILFLVSAFLFLADALLFLASRELDRTLDSRLYKSSLSTEAVDEAAAEAADKDEDERAGSRLLPLHSTSFHT
jgi:hypothetical protein